MKLPVRVPGQRRWRLRGSMRKSKTALSHLREVGGSFKGGQIRVELGIEENPASGKAEGFMKFGTVMIRFDADRADEYAVDFRRIALELRNGGALG